MIRMRTIDRTGDTVENYDNIIDATKKFKSMKKTHLAYDGDTNTILHKLTPDVGEVIFTSKLVGG